MINQEEINSFFSKYIDSPDYNKIKIENDNIKIRTELEIAALQAKMIFPNEKKEKK
jgi:hypothetical protein